MAICLDFSKNDIYLSIRSLNKYFLDYVSETIIGAGSPV